MPAFQIKMQALPILNFRYFTCLLDKGHINPYRFLFDIQNVCLSAVQPHYPSIAI